MMAHGTETATVLPNLLVIHTDQQSLWTISAYGSGVLHTPHIDRLGAEGARCDQFFTNSAVCTPSRGCFVTGRYPESHGAYTNNIPLNADEVTFAQALKDYGYATGYAGKWHLDGRRRPGWVHEERGMGFEDNEFMFNRGHWKKIEDSTMADVSPTVYDYRVVGDETTYTTDWLTNKALEFIRRDRDRPFCFMLSLPDPHAPVTVRAPYDAMFSPQDMLLPETFDDAPDLEWVRQAQARSPWGPHVPDRADRLRRFLALYYGECALIDDAIGRLLAALEEMGILDDTIVVFTTDHGEYAGEHGLMGKNELYETAHRIPMLIRYPRRIPAGTVVNNVLSTVDFQPTILGLMGAPPGGREQGHDASALLTGEGCAWTDEAHIHHSSRERAGIFTPDFELAFLRGGGHILFDRRNDPLQVDNRFHDPAMQSVVRELGERILKHHDSVNSRAAAWLPELLDG